MKRIHLFILPLLLAAAGAAAEDEKLGFCIPANMEATTTALIEDPGFGVPIEDSAGTMAFESISIDKDTVTFSLTRLDESTETASAALARITLHPAEEAKDGDPTTENFAIHRVHGTRPAEDISIRPPSMRPGPGQGADEIVSPWALTSCDTPELATRKMGMPYSRARIYGIFAWRVCW